MTTLATLRGQAVRRFVHRHREMVVAMVVGMIVLGPRGIAAAGPESVARLWRRSRGDNPGEGIASSVADQLRRPRFHFDDGRAPGSVSVLPAEVLQRLRPPMVALRASTLRGAIGIGWFLRAVDSVDTVGHGRSQVRRSVPSSESCPGVLEPRDRHGGWPGRAYRWICAQLVGDDRALGLVADLLYALGYALWTGVVVVAFIQILPEAKRRQLRGRWMPTRRPSASRPEPAATSVGG